MNAVFHMATRWYGGLLRLYPREFQTEFGVEQQGVFAEMAAEAAEHGSAQLALVCLRELRDMPFSLALAHWRSLRKRFGMENIPLIPNPTRAARWGAIGFALAAMLATIVWSILQFGIGVEMPPTDWQGRAMHVAFKLLLAAVRGGLVGAVLGLALYQRVRLRQYIWAGAWGFVACAAIGALTDSLVMGWVRSSATLPLQNFLWITPYSIATGLVTAAILLAAFGGFQHSRPQAARMFLLAAAGFILGIVVRDVIGFLTVTMVNLVDSSGAYGGIGWQVIYPLILGASGSAISGWFFGWALGQQKAGEVRRVATQVG